MSASSRPVSTVIHTPLSFGDSLVPLFLRTTRNGVVPQRSTQWELMQWNAGPNVGFI